MPILKYNMPLQSESVFFEKSKKLTNVRKGNNSVSKKNLFPDIQKNLNMLQTMHKTEKSDIDDNVLKGRYSELSHYKINEGRKYKINYNYLNSDRSRRNKINYNTEMILDNEKNNNSKFIHNDECNNTNNVFFATTFPSNTFDNNKVLTISKELFQKILEKYKHLSPYVDRKKLNRFHKLHNKLGENLDLNENENCS